MTSRPLRRLCRARARGAAHLRARVRRGGAEDLLHVRHRRERRAARAVALARGARGGERSTPRRWPISPDEFDALLRDDGLTKRRRFALAERARGDEAGPASASASWTRSRARSGSRCRRGRSASCGSRARACARAWRSRSAQGPTTSSACEHALGEVLESDLRLIEDLRCATEDEGIDIMSVAR